MKSKNKGSLVFNAADSSLELGLRFLPLLLVMFLGFPLESAHKIQVYINKLGMVNKKSLHTFWKVPFCLFIHILVTYVLVSPFVNHCICHNYQVYKIAKINKTSAADLNLD